MRTRSLNIYWQKSHRITQILTRASMYKIAGPRVTELSSRVRLRALALILLACTLPISAATIGIASMDGFLHDSTGLLAIYDNTSANFFSALNTNNIGSFGWTYANTGPVTLTDVRFFGFLDADIDRAINGASNEYGQVVSQTLPPGAPTDAIGWNSFQIDEPGFVSGTIFDNLLAGFLDDTNHCPPGTQNDVSLALGLDIGKLDPGQSFTATFLVSGSNIGGLSQTDPDSNYTFYFNGFSTNPAASIPVSAPEPGTGSMLALLVVGFFVRKARYASAIIFLAVFAAAAQAQMQLTPAASTAGFKLTLFADGFPNVYGIGPVGIGFPNSGGVVVTDYPGNVRLFPTNTDGQHANAINPAQNLGSSSGAGIAKAGGHIFAGDQTAGSLLQLNDDGTTNQVIISSGLPNDAGVAANPTNRHIFVSVRGGPNSILDINPVTKTVTTFVDNVSADGLTFSPDGSVLYAAVISSDHIIGYRVSDGAQIFDSGFISSLDGCAVGTGSLAGLLFVNTNDGRLVEVSLATSVQTVMASGGSRGDLVSSDPKGSLLLTQTDSILRLTAPAGGGFGGTPPVISDVLTRFKEESADIFWSPPFLPTASQSTGSINVCYNCQNSFGIPPQTDGPVFIIQNTGTAPITNARLTINPPNGIMDAFLIGSIAPSGTFLLTPGVSDDGGTGHTFFAVTGSVLDTSDSGPNSDSTQFRLTGTQGLSNVDTGIFTPAATRGTSNDGTENINFLGNEDAACNNCFGPKVVATLFLPPNSTLSSYNLYRRTDSLPFSQIQSGLTTTHYTDFNLRDGTTYYYVVRWVDSNGVESPNSTEISATPTSIASLISHNIPPTILSNPVVLATVGNAYRYAVNSSNPVPGDVLTFSLPIAPAGMTIDSAKGVISWTPAVAQTGTATAKVRVQDRKGNFASQMYQITVQAAPPTVPPMITSMPVLSATASQIYNYQVLASDPNTGAILTYSVPTAPAGVMITSNSGFLQWVPTAAQVGSQNITIKVQDQFGLSTTQSFTVIVASAPVLSPVITSAPVLTAVATQPYSYQVTATDPNAGQTLAFSLPSAPSGLTINATTGLIQWTPAVAQEGSQNVVVKVQDSLGRFATQLFTLAVSSPLLAPTITIDSPVANSTITQVTSIIGSISDPNGTKGGPLTWTVAILKPGAASYETIGTGNGAVSNAAIAEIDPTLLSNNIYPVRVTAIKGPFTRTADLSYSVAGNLKLGQFTIQFTDLSIPVAGIPITITRRYDSLDTSTGEFGAGWRLALPGQVTDSAHGQAYTVLTRIYVTRPDGTRVGFTFSPTYTGSFILPSWSPGFMPDPGVTDTLSVPSDTLFYSGGGFYDFSGAYDPTLFTLTTKEGLQYLIDENAGLQKITDTNGNTLTVTPGGLISSTGVSVTFARDAKNRITKITEPGNSPGTLQYTYDTATGNLTSFTDQLDHTTTYSYENRSFPNYLTKIVDPLGRPLIRNVYDASGRIIAQCDANGNIVTLAGCAIFHPDPTANLQTVINARGFRTDLLLDANGNVLTERHWLDDVNYLDTVRTYDSNNNLLTQTDPAGNKTTYTYDAAGNMLSQVDPLGHKTTYTYNFCNKVLTTTDPAGNVTANTYDTACNLLTAKDALNHVTTYKYNAEGQQSEFIDAVGNHWVWAYDSSGFLKSLTDPFGNATTTTFGPTGDLLSRIDRNLRRIDFQYDNAHHLIKETWNTSPARITTYSYNVAGELTGASDPDSTLAVTYTAVGQLASVDNGGTPGVPHVMMSYVYDGNNNVTSVQDSLGGVTNYLYDPLDRLNQANQSGTGVNAKRVDYQYDNASFLTQLSRFSDLAGTQSVANTLFETDCDGCPGRLTAIRHRKALDNSVIQDLTFVRDSLGNVTSSTDAEGTHSYDYDLTQQLTSANHSNPALQPNEFYTYDAAGNRLTSHISASYTYSYSVSGAGNRLTQDQQFTYQYDAEGNLIRKTNRATGVYSIFSYDYRNLMTSAVLYTPGGVQTGAAQYVYDAFRRRILAKENNQVEAFIYDALNPILKISNANVILSRRLYNRSLDGILADDASRQTRWFLTDQVGSARDLVNTSGVAINHYIYDSFGKDLIQTNPASMNDLLFVGREQLDIGDLEQFRSREYQASIGRFLSEDSIPYFSYPYASNNPLKFNDPLGLDVEEATLLNRIVVPLSTLAQVISVDVAARKCVAKLEQWGATEAQASAACQSVAENVANGGILYANLAFPVPTFIAISAIIGVGLSLF